MTQDEIKQGLLQVCKVKGWDSDINIVGFHSLCDKLKQLGAAEERERFYGQDRPVECVKGCPPRQICDYCQVVAPVKAMILAEREACAKLCDLAMLQGQEAINELEDDEYIAKCFIQGAMTQLVKTSKAIRARGQA